MGNSSKLDQAMTDLYSAFPNLRMSQFTRTSPADARYNCIAWASEDDKRFWWPIPPYYWPSEAPLEVTLAAFEAAYAVLGYTKCSDGALKRRFEKIAIYADFHGTPTHAARQLPNGRWTSKLGRDIDIEHTLEALEGDQYGSVARFMKRKRRIASGGRSLFARLLLHARRENS